jgi:hemerythrin-like metal-binding protein
MAFLFWEYDLSVDIESIDNQHKKLIDLINQFYENIRLSSNKELIADLIAGMKSYTIFHFNAEEKLLKQYNYPDFEIHKKEHENFLNKVNDLENRFRAGKLIISFEITDFLKKWIRNHIMETDSQYSGFLKNKGVK